MKRRTFEEFVDAAKQKRQISEWVRQPTGLRIYARCAIRVAGGFELANVEVPSRKQKKGIFSTFLTEWETKLPLLIENVHSTYLENHLIKREGWEATDPDFVGIGTSWTNKLWRDDPSYFPTRQ